MPLREKIIKETVWSFITKGCVFILFFAIQILLSRGLGPEQFGRWSFLFSLITVLAGIFYFGINASTQKFIAQYNNTGHLKGVIRQTFLIRLIGSLVAIVVLLLLYKYIIILSGKIWLNDYYWLTIILVILMTFNEYFQSLFKGIHRIKLYFFAHIGDFIIRFSLLLSFFILWEFDLQVVLKSYSFSIFINILIAILIFYFACYRYLSDKKLNLKMDIIRYSFPLFFITLGFMLLSEIDILMIGVLRGDYEVGIYSIAKQITMKLPHISLAIAIGTMPIFAKINKNNKASLKKSFYKLLKINIQLFVPIVIGIVFLGPYLIPLFFGEHYLESILPLQILSIYVFLFSNSIFLSSFLDYVGKAKKRALNLIITMILVVILNYILIPKYGAVGAAISTTLAYLPYFTLNLIEVRSFLK